MVNVCFDRYVLSRCSAPWLWDVQGKFFYRIIDRFIDQTGAEVESIFGGPFKDDPGGLQLKHDRPGLMSCANLGPDTTTSHFSTMVRGLRCMECVLWGVPNKTVSSIA